MNNISINNMKHYEQARWINKNTKYTAQTGNIGFKNNRESDGKVVKTYSWGDDHLEKNKKEVWIDKQHNGLGVRASKDTDMFFIDMDDYNSDKVQEFKDKIFPQLPENCWIKNSSSGGINICFKYDEDIHKAIDNKDSINGIDMDGFKIDVCCRKQCCFSTITNGEKVYKASWDDVKNPINVKELDSIPEKFKETILSALKKYNKSQNEEKAKKIKISPSVVSEFKESLDNVSTDIRTLLDKLDVEKRSKNEYWFPLICAIGYETNKSTVGFELANYISSKMPNYDYNHLKSQWKSVLTTKENWDGECHRFTIRTLKEYAEEDTGFDLLYEKCVEARKKRISWQQFTWKYNQWAIKTIPNEIEEEMIIDLNRCLAILEIDKVDILRFNNGMWQNASWEEMKKMFYVKKGKFKMTLDKYVVPWRKYMPIFYGEEFSPQKTLKDNFTFNAWTGFKAYDPSIKTIDDVDMSVVDPWIKLVRDGFAHKESDKAKDWLVKRLLIHPLQNPHIKLNTKIVIYNHKQQKANKGRFADFDNEMIIGRTHCGMISGLKGITKRFNHEYAYYVMLFSDEATTEGDVYHTVYNELKALDNPYFNTERKFGNTTRRENKMTYVIFTNVKMSVRQELGDERIAQFEAKEDWDDDFMAQIAKLHTCPYSAKHVLAWARFQEYDVHELRKVPMTTTKLEVMESSLPAIQRFCLEIKRNSKYFFDDRTEIFAQDLFRTFRDWAMKEGEDPDKIKKISSKKFGGEVGVLIKSRKHTNGKLYDITTIDIRDELVHMNPEGKPEEEVKQQPKKSTKKQQPKLRKPVSTTLKEDIKRTRSNELDYSSDSSSSYHPKNTEVKDSSDSE